MDKTIKAVGVKEMLETMYSEGCQVFNCTLSVHVNHAPGPFTPKVFGEDLNQLFAFMETLQYNGFEGKNAVAFLKKNIKKIYEIKFGREYSPVLYIKLQRDVDGDAFKNAVQDTLHPDENDFQSASLSDPRVLRVWFD